MYPWQYCRIYGLELPILRISSVITGMHGAKAGAIPPRRSLPSKYVNNGAHVVLEIEKSDLDQVLSRN